MSLMAIEKWAYALATVLAYALLCGAIAWQHRQRVNAMQRQAAALGPASAGVPAWWVVYASQTGQAESLALQAAQALHKSGVSVRLAALGQVTARDLQGADRLLCIASTYGEGDPPDGAAAFARHVMAVEGASLAHLRVGLLALGDKAYAHYCGFGRRLDRWFATRGAQPLFERIDVDKSDSSALQLWREHLARLTGSADLPEWESPAFQPWRIRARHHLNPGSAGEEMHHIELEPEAGANAPDWQAGDLVQIEVPTAPGEPRDYSVASVPQDGAVHLLVRRARRPDGQTGIASGWLTQGAATGARVMLRVRSNTGFRIGSNADRPLILIGNGSGLAGLRAHIRGRLATAGHLVDGHRVKRPAEVAPMWLLMGERNARCDAHHFDELEALALQGWLTRMDWVFSRDHHQQRYVQHLLAASAPLVREWVGAGAALYVCGSLEGMASEVQVTLQSILGDEVLQNLAAEGRYRRDVY
jgi:sulfite reductase (NADPH) flavoprotein alpha-component